MENVGIIGILAYPKTVKVEEMRRFVTLKLLFFE